MQGLESMGFKEATPIQQQAIPVILEGRDLLGCAQTGTGKTAAFLLPVIHKIVSQQTSGVNTLIIVPTRELAQQIDQQIEGLGYFVSVSSKAVFGGGDGISWESQRRSLQEGADIVVATPGRLIAMLTMGKLNLSSVKHLILDEADRMLDMGFYDDIVRIISYLPAKRQNLMFSATMPPKIAVLAQKILHQPHHINLSLSKPAEGVSQRAYVVYDNQKEELLLSLLADLEFESMLIFSSTRIKVKKIHEMLKSKRIDAEAFHSDLDQKEREEILRKFKNKQLPIIVATDVLSRGIDVDNISVVLNFDAPGDPEDYVHRVGRTARAAKTGVAITFVGLEEQRKFAGVERLIGYEVEKVGLPAGLGEGPVYDPRQARGRQGNRPFRRAGKGQAAAFKSGGSRATGSADKDEKKGYRPKRRKKNRKQGDDA